ncbi:hypothetical protein AKN87_01470 [Thiopseudomonas alkaliphila]|uniref:Murein L,D-transpeptidase catalytic domain family protein n=1 Tax=Thiopseudomonas alkaliphila TaxID=1697053 RepID=A0A0K1XGF3_9GAMM|nr:murein L,D-transpeptidase catalytic domain family protein [Thiopseudomonas alkaliphila]AKX43928.1 hypothetical protein AKN87_01470 [Thiopseudomonas alkaliphila]AKX49281.1 hypothetical protein AKN93_07595 [Thiopseudomonas alkaliphila]AKX51975.1 hypothetical protein AKN92_11160 [Thiopseudomonas alkaliphila]AKX52812.1 hypothetical protein AKN91_03365 [Thiopseudomonas alkaliphila]AKX56205.1 hypothetical protein AKN90_11200 [Thiopseudomonas alkaliphila]
MARSLFSLGKVTSLIGGLLLSAFATANPHDTLTLQLSKQAPDLNKKVLSHAVSAMKCALSNTPHSKPAERLAVIDFSLPSTQQRLWIFDLKAKTLVLQDLVSHGMKSGDNLASSFSNTEGSHQSSLGLFRTAESYTGRNGYSLRLDGLESGFNDRARERAIVIHGADYVNPDWIQSQGRIGRSQGCPAVRPEIANQVIDQLKHGQFVFSWYPDQEWLANSTYLNCPSNQRIAANSNQHRGG